MRHRIQDKRFNRDANERKALLNGLLRALTEQGEIVTTRARAKVLKRLADKIVSQAKTDTLASRRTLHKVFGKRDVVNTLVDRVAPAMADRQSGFTRMVSMGSRRGDNTPMVKISWTNQPAKTGDLKSGKTWAEPAKKAEKKAETKTEKKAVEKTEVKAEKSTEKKSVVKAKPAAKKKEVKK